MNLDLRKVMKIGSLSYSVMMIPFTLIQKLCLVAVAARLNAQIKAIGAVAKEIQKEAINVHIVQHLHVNIANVLKGKRKVQKKT